TGRLLSIRSRTGVTKTLSYDAQGQLVAITDSFGRSVTYSYHASGLQAGRLASVTDYAGNVSNYAYDDRGNVISVTHADGHVRSYLYNEAAHITTSTQTLPDRMTGVIDENGGRHATYKYDNSSRATSSELAGGVNKYTLTLPSGYYGSTTVVDPLGTSRTYNFNPSGGAIRLYGVSQPCPTCGGNNAQNIGYDAHGNVTSRTDFKGNKTVYQYNLTRNLEISRTRSDSTGAVNVCLSGGGYASGNYNSACTVGTCWQSTPFPGSQDATPLGYPGQQYACAQSPTTSTTWHATYRLPLSITEPAASTTLGGAPGTKLTEFTYDTAGNMLTRKVTAPKNDGSGTNEIRTWTYTYNALGQVLTAKDPLNKTTTTVYYAATDTASPPKYTMGDVQTITNAAGHVVTMNEYDRNGRVTKMTDANGLVTTMAYHPRGWLSSRTVSNGATSETTFYTYDKTGQLTRVTMPDGTNLFYAYDAAHRLVGMSDQLSGARPETTTVTLNPPGGTSYSVTIQSLIVNQANLAGNKIVYSLDNMGNRIKEEYFDPSNT
ncbi:MAG: hypothetical protein ACRDAM_02715, partial [Casimicrobium sp.]